LQIDLTDPELFRANAFWPALAWLRAHDPVHWHADSAGSGFWVLTKYADIVTAYANTDVFSSKYGMRLGSDPDAVAAVAGRMLIVSDPPGHSYLKRVLTRAFSPGAMARIEGLVRDVVVGVLADALARGELEFVEVAKLIPNHVVCALLGVPRQDWSWLGALTTDAFESGDAGRRGAHAEIFLYFADLLAERRASPGEDLVSQIATDRDRGSGVDGTPALTDEEIIFNCNGILAGANETTRYSAAGGLLEFACRPDQWRLLRGGGEAAVRGGVEEVLRWTTPGVHALRTALMPEVIRGVPIAAGQRVTLWNSSANRDEAVFDRPGEFDIRRTPNRHVTFGHGRHLCLGARLARLELGIFLTELAARTDRIEVTADPLYNSSNFTWGLCELPVRLTPASRR
jgi:cytochrome P450